MKSDSIKELRKNGVRKLMTEVSSSRDALNPGGKRKTCESATRPWIKTTRFTAWSGFQQWQFWQFLIKK